MARARGAEVLLRIEDHDGSRSRPEFEASIRDDLAWLGFVPDAEVPRQSERGERYSTVLAQLERAHLAYPCECSRKDIATSGGGDAIAPGVEYRYPGTCRDADLGPATTPARRVRMDAGIERFDDLALGPQAQSPADECGDFLAHDRFSQWTYQFAVSVDDFDQGVNLVVRGDDLLASTGRQLRLARLIGRAKPAAFYHHALVRKTGGAKLSKSDGDTGVRELRAAGLTAASVIGEAARAAGLQAEPEPVHALDVARMFAPAE